MRSRGCIEPNDGARFGSAGVILNKPFDCAQGKRGERIPPQSGLLPVRVGVRLRTRFPIGTRALGWTATVCAIIGIVGCGTSTAEIDRFAEGVQRVPLGADNDIPRFLLGFPTRTASRAWWYLRPEPDGIRSDVGGLSALFRFDERKKVIEREYVEWARIGANLYRLRSDRLTTERPGADELDFAGVLGEKLAELAGNNTRYTFTRQEASYQLMSGGVLILSMERWTRPGSRLTSVRGEVDAAAHPQVADAVRLAWQIRRFTIALDFDATIPGTGDSPRRAGSR